MYQLEAFIWLSQSIEILFAQNTDYKYGLLKM